MLGAVLSVFDALVALILLFGGPVRWLILYVILRNRDEGER